MKNNLSNEKQLAKEARDWDERTMNTSGWEDAPEAIVRSGESKAISIRLPALMIEVLKGFAEREGTGYQILIKRWLDERIRSEAESIKNQTWRYSNLPPRELNDCNPDESENRHLRLVA